MVIGIKSTDACVVRCGGLSPACREARPLGGVCVCRGMLDFGHGERRTMLSHALRFGSGYGCLLPLWLLWLRAGFVTVSDSLRALPLFSFRCGPSINVWYSIRASGASSRTPDTRLHATIDDDSRYSWTTSSSPWRKSSLIVFPMRSWRKLGCPSIPGVCGPLQHDGHCPSSDTRLRFVSRYRRASAV